MVSIHDLGFAVVGDGLFQRLNAVDFHLEVTQVFHRELTHLEVMFRGSGLGQDIVALLLFSRSYSGTGFEAEAVVAGLQDVAAVGQAVE